MVQNLPSKKIATLFISLLFLSGCVKVDTDPTPGFTQVQDSVATLTGQTVYWDCSLQEKTMAISAQELLQKELTDDLVVQIALLNNPSLQATYESLGIAKAQLAQAGLLKNPIFAFSYQFSTQPNITDLITIDLLQNFLEILLIPLKKRMAKAELEAAKSMVTAQILDIIAETKISFYRLQAAEKIWNLKKKILLTTKLSYEAAKRLYRAGNIRYLQVATEQTFYEQAKLDLSSWEITVLQAREKLHVLMGLWGRQICWKISPELPAIPSEEDGFKNIENIAIANSIDLKIAYEDLLATAAELGVDTSRLVFPQFNMGVSSEREESIWYVGPAFTLAIPLFDFGQANSAKARARIMQKWKQYTALAIEIRSKARSFRFSLLNDFRQSRYLEEVVVPLAEQVTHTTLLQHNAMQLGVFSLLLAKREELEKKIESVLMQRDYLVSKITLQTLLQGHVLGKHLFEASLRKHYE